MNQSGDEDVLRILHTSDWHLGRAFGQFRPLEQERLRHARFTAVENLLGIARKEAVHAVLVAGDVFEDAQPPESVWRRLHRVLEQNAPGCPLVLLPGNHDPLIEGSVWEPSHRFRRALPDWAHVVDHDDFRLALPEGATLFSTPTRSRKSSHDPVKRLPAREPGDQTVRIGLAHGQVFQIGDQAANHPIDVAAARTRGFDYIALGDTHSLEDLDPEHPGTVFYSGTPEQAARDEREPGQAVLVHVRRSSRRTKVTPMPVGSLQWRSVTVSSLEALEALMKEDLQQVVLQLKVEGRFDPEHHREVERLLDLLRGDEHAPGPAAALTLQTSYRLDDAGIEGLLEDAPEELRVAARLLREKRADPSVEEAVVDRALARLFEIAREVTR